uniref:Uncharacterized protein n=1 Tax=Arundo donax TaxID=35708 RepID=A0A0A8XQN8_ARUDO
MTLLILGYSGLGFLLELSVSTSFRTSPAPLVFDSSSWTKHPGMTSKICLKMWKAYILIFLLESYKNFGLVEALRKDVHRHEKLVTSYEEENKLSVIKVCCFHHSIVLIEKLKHFFLGVRLFQLFLYWEIMTNFSCQI